MSAKFTEDKLEEAFIELLGQERITHVVGTDITQHPEEVLIKQDLKGIPSRSQ
jgi:type I restriction enzyme R subunit